MGIPYYAYPIAAHHYEEAVKDPCRFHGSDPLMDAWGPKKDQPEMLHLDKSWNELQVLFGTGSGVTDRPALKLVGGRVTEVEMGWIPYERAVSPSEVKQIAADLALIRESDIRRLLPKLNRWNDEPEQKFEYVAQFLAQAKAFTTKLASEGRGLVYMIG